MKFMYFFLPSIPATLEERRALRPIANRTDRWQRMIEEVVEIAQLAEEVGFDAVCFPEHHLHSEGMEIRQPAAGHAASPRGLTLTFSKTRGFDESS